MAAFRGAGFDFLTNYSLEVGERGMVIVAPPETSGGLICGVWRWKRGTASLLGLIFPEVRRCIVGRRKT